MNDLMIDLESMGKKPNAPIVSIGAVFFNPQTGELGQEFYTAVSLESAMAQARGTGWRYVLWLVKQSPGGALSWFALMMRCLSLMHCRNLAISFTGMHIISNT